MVTRGGTRSPSAPTQPGQDDDVSGPDPAWTPVRGRLVIGRAQRPGKLAEKIGKRAGAGL